MAPPNKINEFLDIFQHSLTDDRFTKLTLGDYDGPDQQLRNIYIRPVIIKRIPHLSFTYRYKTRDIVKNFTLKDGPNQIRKILGTEFRMAHLVTRNFEMTLQHNALKKAALQAKDAPSKDHNRQKKYALTDGDHPYLQALGLTDINGRILATAQDKFRQINKYIEIVSGMIEDQPKKKSWNIVDMGAGKGYLTFALYDHLISQGFETDMTGVEYRDDLVTACNSIINDLGYTKFRFVQGTIENYQVDKIDLLIALHACNTATDDAIAKGIKSSAGIIVVSPCCHKQIRQEIKDGKKKNELDFITRHGIFLERQAEMVTDGLRAMILEYFGYKTKVFEFISDAHTAKNTMIVGVKGSVSAKDKTALLAKIKATKDWFGIRTHHLEQVMGI